MEEPPLKKQKTGKEEAETQGVVINADQCVTALERALEAMNPPLEVFTGILRLIAELVPYVRFDAGSGLEFFTISDDGATATRNLKGKYGWQFACASPIVSQGVHEATIRIEAPLGYMTVGVGVIPVSKASSTDGAEELGYMLYNNGGYYAKNVVADSIRRKVSYGEGDTITVRLDLDSNTIVFRKNDDEAIGSPQAIAHDAYYFAFDSDTDETLEGNAVSIVGVE